MTLEELNKIETPFPMEIESHIESDKYGTYATGAYKYKGKIVVVAIEDGIYHLSVSSNHPLGYYELKDVRYTFLPNRIRVAQIFPPREEFVNVHEHCFHLWEIKEER